jgi:hypothetical protein
MNKRMKKVVKTVPAIATRAPIKPTPTIAVKAPVINPKNFTIGGKLFKNKTQLYAYISAYINPKPAVVTNKQVLKRGKNGIITPI